MVSSACTTETRCLIVKLFEADILYPCTNADYCLIVIMQHASWSSRTLVSSLWSYHRLRRKLITILSSVNSDGSKAVISPKITVKTLQEWMTTRKAYYRAGIDEYFRQGGNEAGMPQSILKAHYDELRDFSTCCVASFLTLLNNAENTNYKIAYIQGGYHGRITPANGTGGVPGKWDNDFKQATLNDLDVGDDKAQPNTVPRNIDKPVIWIYNDNADDIENARCPLGAIGYHTIKSHWSGMAPEASNEFGDDLVNSWDIKEATIEYSS